MSPPPPHPPLPRWIGHRGAALRAPENTLAGLRRGAADGARWVEFDLRLSADGVPVLMHDETLDRTTDASGPLRALRFAELQKLDAGGRFDAAFRGERIPSLAQALRCCAELGLGANLEFKSAPGEEAAMAEAVARDLQEHPVPVILSAFEPTALEAAARRLPALARGFLTEGAPVTAADAALALGCASLHVAAEALDAEVARKLRRHGASLLAYTVNQPERAHQLFDWGVCAIFTDDPARFADAL